MDTTTCHPSLADCASGKLNAQTLHCSGHSRSMSYAACLARLKANDEKEQGIPVDWTECGQHRRSGQCNAAKMRDEELTACKPLYFVERGVAAVTDLATAAVKWVTSPAAGMKKGELKVVGSGKGASALDHLAKVDYAAAISAAAIQPAMQKATPASMAAPSPAAIHAFIQALPGESPLQMARRIAAERAALSTPTK